MQWWMHAVYDSGGLAAVLGWVFWVIFSICLHELAHGWAAIWQGDRTPRETGHMTMNPMVHMGGASLIVFALVGIAWGLMPTDPSRYRWGRRGRIAVAAAGPLMNLLIAVVSLLILVGYLHLAPSDHPTSHDGHQHLGGLATGPVHHGGITVQEHQIRRCAGLEGTTIKAQAVPGSGGVCGQGVPNPDHLAGPHATGSHRGPDPLERVAVHDRPVRSEGESGPGAPQ